MSAHLHPTRPDEHVDYHAAEGLNDLQAQEPLTIPPELGTPDDRKEWSLVAAGLAGVVAILAAVLAVFAFAAAGGDDRATVVEKAAHAPAAHAAAPATAPSIDDAKGIAFEPFERVDPDAARHPGGQGQDVRRRRLPARHPGQQGPRPDRGLELRRQRHEVLRHRRVGADGRDRGRSRRLHAHQRLDEGHEGRPAALARLPLRRGRPGHALRRPRPGKSMHYRFVAEHPGVFMYHCATQPVLMHTGAGMVGMFVVKPRGPRSRRQGAVDHPAGVLHRPARR